MRFASCLTLFLLLTGFPATASEEVGVAERVGPVTLGGTVPGFEGRDPRGALVRLVDLEITSEAVREAVFAAARTHGVDAPSRATPLDALPDLAGEHEVDASALARFAGRVGRRFGLVPSPARLEAFGTLGDIEDWLLASKHAPVGVLLWSSGCDTCVHYCNEKWNTLVSEEGLRTLVLASHPHDTAALVTTRLERAGLEWLVLMDQEQHLKEIFVEGGTHTPYVFLLDREHVLRYRGAIDSDPTRAPGEEGLVEYVRNAVHALAAGRAPDIAETRPRGCPLKAVARRPVGD